MQTAQDIKQALNSALVELNARTMVINAGGLDGDKEKHKYELDSLLRLSSEMLVMLVEVQATDRVAEVQTKKFRDKVLTLHKKLCWIRREKYQELCRN